MVRLGDLLGKDHPFFCNLLGKDLSNAQQRSTARGKAASSGGVAEMGGICSKPRSCYHSLGHGGASS